MSAQTATITTTIDPMCEIIALNLAVRPDRERSTMPGTIPASAVEVCKMPVGINVSDMVLPEGLEPSTAPFSSARRSRRELEQEGALSN